MDRAAFVSTLRAQYPGIDQDAAERAADVNGFVDRPPSAEELARQERDAAVAEREEQRQISNRFRVCGFTVRNLSQARASKQSPGLADLFITHDTKPWALWWESKRQVGGRYSDAQLTFRADCRRCGVLCEGGDRHDAERWLVVHGHACMGNDGKITRRVGTTLEPNTPRDG